MSAPESIEAVFARLCDEHDLKNISVIYHAEAIDAGNWSSSVQWEGFDGCAFADRWQTTAGAAVADAIRVMKEKRSSDRISVPDLAIFGAS